MIKDGSCGANSTGNPHNTCDQLHIFRLRNSRRFALGQRPAVLQYAPHVGKGDVALPARISRTRIEESKSVAELLLAQTVQMAVSAAAWMRRNFDYLRPWVGEDIVLQGHGRD